MIGSNVPLKGGYATAFQYGDEWGCECIQIYLTPSRTWYVPALSRDTINAFTATRKKSQVKLIVAHVPILVNLAASTKEIWERSVARMKTEIAYAHKLGVPYLVLHPGSYGNSTRKHGTRRIINAINNISRNIDNFSTKILLETMAGQGRMIGFRFEEIGYILEEVEKPELLGVCFDTAHVFAAGYDIRGLGGYNAVMKKFDDAIGLDKIKVIHLNDSKTKLFSRSDRHAAVGEGELGLQVFHAILTDERFVNIPKILEIPERDEKSKKSLELLRELAQNPAPSSKSVEMETQLELEVFRSVS